MEDMTAYTLPFGKHKGEPLASLGTSHILWLLSQDGVRHKYPTFVWAGLAELRERLTNLQTVADELTPLVPPPKRWTTKRERRAQHQLQVMTEPLRQQIAAIRAAKRAARDQFDGSDLV